MKRRVITRVELVNMSKNEFDGFQIMLRAKAYRLLGFNWTKWISFTENTVGDLEVAWE